MIQVVKSDERYHANRGWLDTRWHFSFDEYYDPDNMNWGPLRVFNDDVIQPGKGFGFHPHRDMEIITYVIEGELEHRDDMGHTGVVRAGEVQVMSAGTGIVHAEYNHSQERPVHLLQMWILPRVNGRKPRWEQQQFTVAMRQGKWLPVVSSGSLPGTLMIDQEAQIYISSLKSSQLLSHRSEPRRKAYFFIISGSALLNGIRLDAGDQARVTEEAKLTVQAASDAELILLDLPG